MKIGIFDSGIGGEAVAQLLATKFPSATIMTVNDREHLPYGDRDAGDIAQLTDSAIQPLLAAHCDVIIIACNSATSAALDTLRLTYPDQLFVGLDPMVKPAANLTTSGIIAVCATPATLSSARYHRLKDTYGQSITILEPDCSEWARMIEDSALNELHIAAVVDQVCTAGADVIILACTHFHWIRETLEKSSAGRAQIIDPSDAVARQVQSLLERR